MLAHIEDASRAGAGRELATGELTGASRARTGRASSTSSLARTPLKASWPRCFKRPYYPPHNPDKPAWLTLAPSATIHVDALSSSPWPAPITARIIRQHRLVIHRGMAVGLAAPKGFVVVVVRPKYFLGVPAEGTLSEAIAERRNSIR